MLMGLKHKRLCQGLTIIKGENGFTLIETILALSITVIILALLLSSLRLGYISWEKGEGAIEEAATRRFIAEKFSADVCAAYLYIQDNDGKKVYHFKASENELGFVTANHTGAITTAWGGSTFVNYFSGDDGLIVTERTVPFSNITPEKEPRQVELEPDVKKVIFEYMGEDGWAKSWEMATMKVLPSAIRAEFFFSNNKRPLKVTVPLGLTNQIAPKSVKESEGA
jgi:prepilin-type N-terminal cleavage/methylation domain-containing protein